MLGQELSVTPSHVLVAAVSPIASPRKSPRCGLLGSSSAPLQQYTHGTPVLPIVSPRQVSTLGELGKQVFNYSNLTISNALVAVPFAVQQAGMISGVLILFVIVVLSGFVSYRMVLAGRKTRRLCFEGLAGFTMGPAGYYIALAVMLINELGSMVSRLVLVGDMAGPIHRTWIPNISRAHIVIIICSVVVLPLSLLRKMSDLRYSSILSLLANIMVITLLAVTAATVGAGAQLKEVEPVMGKDPFMCFGLVSFLYANQVATNHTFGEFSFSIFTSSNILHRSHWRLTVVLSNIISSMVILLVIFAGLAAFGVDVENDILDNYNDVDVWPNVARCCMTFIVLSGFPMDLFIARHVLSRLMGFEDAHEISTSLHVVLTVLIFVTSLYMGAYWHNIGLVQSVVGSVCGVLICFVLPPIFILRSNFILDRKCFVDVYDYFFPPIVVLGALAGYKGICNAYVCESSPTNRPP